MLASTCSDPAGARLRPAAGGRPRTLPDLLPLILRAAANDEAAQGALVRELHPAVFKYLRRWLGTRPHAEELARDLTQDTLLQVLRSVGTCTADNEGQALCWVLTVARNCAGGYLRKTKEELADRVYPEDLDVASHWAGYQEWSRGDAEPTPAFSALLRLLRAAGSGLSEEAQSLLWYRLVQGAQWSEVAEDLGIKNGTARRRYQRVQATLRREVLGRVQELPERERSAVVDTITRFEVRGTQT